MIKKGLLEVHSAVLLFGLAGLFGKLIQLPSLIIVLGRVFFASLFLSIVIVYLKQSIKLKQKKHYFYLLLLGIILTIHWWTFFQSIKVSSVAIGLITFSTFPIFVTFIEPLFSKDKLSFKDIFLAMVTVFGVILVIPRFTLGDNCTQGVLLGTLSGFTFALLSLLNRKYVQQYSSIVVTFYQVIVATFILLPSLFILNPTFNNLDIIHLIILGVIFTGAAHTLFIKGLGTVKVKTASIIASLEPVYGVIAASFFLNETPSLRVILGGITILSCALYATSKQ